MNLRVRFFGLLAVVAWPVLTFLPSCKKSHENPATRSFRMGFQNSAPRFDSYDLLIQSLTLWTKSADAAIITTEVPWDSLLQGEDPVKYVTNNYVGLVEYYRMKEFQLWVYIDPANGLSRTSDANALVALGKSIAQPEMQATYHRFVIVMDSLLHPDHLGLALETNLIRLASPDSIYRGVKKAAAEAANDVRKLDSRVKLSVSVQADVAWGKLGGNGTYIGVNQDFIDFNFIEELGISSYPYFSFSKPQDIPVEYYSKLIESKPMPVFVSEGGWSSQAFLGPSNATISGSPEAQRDYIARQGQLLDKAQAIGVFQLTFTDIDIANLPTGVDPTIKYFAYLGLVDISLEPRPSLATWNQTFARALK